MSQLLNLITITIIALQSSNGEEFDLVFKWKQLAHEDTLQPDVPRDIVFAEQPLPNNSIDETFNSYNNIPMGATHHKGRVFIAVPRRRPGVPATLNVINIHKQKDIKSPPLTAYPEYIINQLHNDYHADPKRIVSVYRTTVDRCDRLWFVDTGMLEYPNNTMQVQRPQLWIIDLNRDRKVRTFEIPESIVQQGVGMASLVVDVDAAEDCGKAFAYIPDLVQGAIYVYSFEANRMWPFRHASFQHDPERAAFNVAGQRFNWDDGIFSITVGGRDPVTRSKPIYYHPMVSTSEFITFTEVLQNEALSSAGGYENLFQRMGDRGTNAQSTMHHYDPESQVIFYAEVNRNLIGCWNTRTNFSAENHDIIHHDNKRLIYPTDLSADETGTIWVLSNNLPTWIYSRLNDTRFNFYLWRQEPRKAIEGTKCATLSD